MVFGDDTKHMQTPIIQVEPSAQRIFHKFLRGWQILEGIYDWELHTVPDVITYFIVPPCLEFI